ncbi:MAG: malate dehydrogenase, partial [Chloroflexi bacterium]|nr:malate dehydrogenase [Chloroflexota bacterium]
MRNKIAFYGAGNVGATAAHWLAEMEIGDCVLFDIFGQVAAGKALDLYESGPAMGFDTRVTGSTDPTSIEGADVVVVTAGIPRKKDPVTGKFPSRDELVKINQEVMEEVSGNIRKYAPESIVIVVSNPLDAMCHVVKHVTGFPRERVIGQAGALDTA